MSSTASQTLAATSQPTSAAPHSTNQLAALSDDNSILQDAPPPYTPNPNIFSGEQAVEYGPSRPFQPVEPVAPQAQATSYHTSTPTFLVTPQSTGLFSWPTQQPWPHTGSHPQSHQTQDPGHHWSEYPRQSTLSPNYTGSSVSSHSLPPPPPRHPASSLGRSNTITSFSAPGIPTQPDSEFATAFYSAAPGGWLPPPTPAPAPNPNPPTSYPFPSEAPIHRAGSGNGSYLSQYPPPSEAPPPNPNPSAQYPLPSEAPVHRATSGSGPHLPQYPPPSEAPPAHLVANHSTIPDDGRPTQTPVPGHPLLRDNKILVYPAGYECDKCAFINLDAIFLSVRCSSILAQATILVTSPQIQLIHVASVGTNTRNHSRALSLTLRSRHQAHPPLRRTTHPRCKGRSLPSTCRRTLAGRSSDELDPISAIPRPQRQSTHLSLHLPKACITPHLRSRTHLSLALTLWRKTHSLSSSVRVIRELEDNSVGSAVGRGELKCCFSRTCVPAVMVVEGCFCNLIM
jgi:hypothetical protein